MNSEIISLTDWLKTPPGRYLLNWEALHFDQTVSDIFGYHALQLGLPEINTLQANRMPHQWLAGTRAQRESPSSMALSSAALGGAGEGKSSLRTSLLADPAALPFPENCLDLVVLPHTLEISQDPHSALREVARVLVPEGRVVISGLNPVSLWGLRQRRARRGADELDAVRRSELIGYWRLRDWLRLLSFEVESARFGCYRPTFSSQKWLDRFGWMDTAGERWWPIFGAVYFLVAVKRVRGVRLLEAGWKTHQAQPSAPGVVVNKDAASKTAQPH